MKICPACKRQFEQNIAFCAFDGQQLVGSKSRDDLEGRIIDYKYQIQEHIARGGTGSVYAATHMHLNMPLAVKIMHREATSDLTAVERFRREAYATMQIRHPNAIAMLDFGVTPDNLVYVVMERLQGKTLRQRLKEERLLSLIEINEIMQQVCAAIAVAHKRKIIHRDLKPENIFLHQDEETCVVKVLDFGIAKFKGSSGDEAPMDLTRQGFVVGTPYYMSPEQCYGKEVDARSDIYSLGIMLYELLTGRQPFTGRSHTAVAVKQAREKPRPIYEVRPNLPAVLNAVVMHALEKSPSNRPNDIVAFADELQAAMKAVTESEFMKVFSEASEQDLEAAVLLTADPKKIAEKTRKPRKKTGGYTNKKEESNNQESSEFSEMPTAAHTELDQEGLEAGSFTMDFAQTEPPSGEMSADLTMSIGNASDRQDSQELFTQIGKEASMLLQIILGDLENNQPIDHVFLSELKGTVDQLRTVIYRLQQTGG
jgi:serine/threonine protein kinase